MMWDGWEKLTDTEKNKSYELLLTVGDPKVMVSLMTVLSQTKSAPPTWKIEIMAFNPGVGVCPQYEHESEFYNLAEAEKKAWERAQEIVQAYQQD